MDSDTLETFKQRLLQMQSELLALDQTAKDATKTVELDQTRVGRLSRMDAMQGQQMAKESERRRQQQLLKIKSALQRIDEKDFGYCIVCDEEIDIRRLELNPSNNRCISCAE